MKRLIMAIRGVGIVGGTWLVYQVIVSVQRAGYFSLNSPRNFVSIANTLVFAILLLMPWNWISKGPLWWPLILLFGFSSILNFVLLLPSLLYGIGWVYFVVLSAFVFVQFTCIFRMRNNNTRMIRQQK